MLERCTSDAYIVRISLLWLPCWRNADHKYGNEICDLKAWWADGHPPCLQVHKPIHFRLYHGWTLYTCFHKSWHLPTKKKMKSAWGSGAHWCGVNVGSTWKERERMIRLPVPQAGSTDVVHCYHGMPRQKVLPCHNHSGSYCRSLWFFLIRVSASRRFVRKYYYRHYCGPAPWVHIKQKQKKSRLIYPSCPPL